MSDLQNVKDEHFKNIDTLMQAIAILNQQKDGVDRELKMVTSKADKKRLTARRTEIIRQIEKAGHKNVMYIGKMIEKSNNIKKQLEKKGNICPIM